MFKKYKLKPKSELDKIPGIKDFWFYHAAPQRRFRLKKVHVFSSDLMECLGVQRSEVDKYLVNKDGYAVHIDAVIEVK